MKAIDAVKAAAAASGIPTTHIGISMGKRGNYVAAVATRDSNPRTDTAAAMLDVCGYKLCAVPADDVPDSALVIDPAERDRP